MEIFQRSHWGVKGAFLAVLHTWGSQLTWHPHLHVLVSGGGKDLKSGEWKQVRSNYLFAVRAMSKVFRGIMLRKIEELESERSVQWPETADSVEMRRDWRLRLARSSWNIFCRPTLRNTRAVVRYLAAYTSRIAISNRRLREIDPERETVSFEWKDYRNNGVKKLQTLPIKAFLQRFSQHLVPKGLRRIRYFGLLMGKKNGIKSLSGAPQKAAGEAAISASVHVCGRCGEEKWSYKPFHLTRKACEERFEEELRQLREGLKSFSLVPPAPV